LHGGSYSGCCVSQGHVVEVWEGQVDEVADFSKVAGDGLVWSLLEVEELACGGQEMGCASWVELFCESVESFFWVVASLMKMSTEGCMCVLMMLRVCSMWVLYLTWQAMNMCLGSCLILVSGCVALLVVYVCSPFDCRYALS
jgi:hypothetical protein